MRSSPCSRTPDGSTYEHEKIAEKLGHIPAETTERLIAGLPAEFSDERQEVVYELVSALVQPRIVAVGLYKRAKKALAGCGKTLSSPKMALSKSCKLLILQSTKHPPRADFDEKRCFSAAC